MSVMRLSFVNDGRWRFSERSIDDQGVYWYRWYRNRDVGYGYDVYMHPVDTFWPSRFGQHAAPGPDGVVCRWGCDAWSISSGCQYHRKNQRPAVGR